MAPPKATATGRTAGPALKGPALKGPALKGPAAGRTAPNAPDWDRSVIEEQLEHYARTQRTPDPLGKRALFSVGERPEHAMGTLTLECASCKRETPVKLREVARLAFPFWMGAPRSFPLYLRCPGCGRRAWLRPRWRL